MKSREPGAGMRGPAGARGSRNARRAVGVLVAGLSLLAPGLVGGVAGCGKPPQPTTRPLTARERQDQALRDPFGYSPDIESTDISGGGLSEFDKEAFRKDLKNVLDP